MNPQLFVREFVAVAYLLVGLSHLLHPRLWAEHFQTQLARPNGPFIVALYTGPLALVIVLLHNVWVLDIPVIVTLLGWIMLIKAAGYLLFPAIVHRVAPQKVRGPLQFRIAGVVCMAFAATVGVDLILDSRAASAAPRAPSQWPAASVSP